MARTTFKIDPVCVDKAWKRAGYKSLKDVFRDDADNENAFMRYDSAQKKINSGSVSYAIMDFLSKRLHCPYEYLTGEYSDREVEDWGMPDVGYSLYQDFLDMTPEEKEQYYVNFVLDMGISNKWKKMDQRQKSNCHVLIKEFANWYLDYVDTGDESFSKLFNFFRDTGVMLESKPEFRKRLFENMWKPYTQSMKK